MISTATETAAAVAVPVSCVSFFSSSFSGVGVSDGGGGVEVLMRFSHIHAYVIYGLVYTLIFISPNVRKKFSHTIV